jgi:hypothetical protein
MTQLQIPASTIPPENRADLAGFAGDGTRSGRRQVPLFVWPVVAMAVMLPVLIVLVVMLLT